jgi:hypothetical protein
MAPSNYTSDIPFLTAYAEQKEEGTEPVTPEVPEDAEAKGDEEIVIPEDLSELDDEALAGLHSAAVEAFNALYGADGSGLTSDEHYEALSVLTAGIERVQTERDSRKAAQTERAEKAKELAQRAGITLAAEGGTDESGPDETPEPEPTEPATTEGDEPAEGDEGDGGEEPKSVQASAPKDIRINLSGLRSRTASMPTPTQPTPTDGPKTMRDIVKAAPEFGVKAPGEGLNWDDIGAGLDRRLGSFNRTQFEAAASRGHHLRSQQSLAVIQKPMEDGLVLRSTDPREAERVMAFATDESRLPNGSLVAAGGWCAPSDTIYDLLETESRDGLYGLPTIGVTRGGINHTPGPSFSDIFALATGFHYTEAQDQAGTYGVDANGIGDGTAGDKPCFRVDCPDFGEDRLDFDGLCVTAGLLQQRGYPEVIARTVRGALVAHDHRIAGRVLNAVIAGSDAVNMPANQVGATAPILTAIELQVEHYRYVHRLARGTSLEAVFPFWVHGAIRSDLSRRLGVDLMDVPDSRIDAWFADRGVAAQFVYNFDDLTGAAGAFVAWPNTVRFALYAAGTWVRGTSDIITLDTLYDSVLLGQNDFTALFTEEGWLVAKRGHDSRIVSVNISADGATHGGVSIDHNGAQAAVAQV